MIKIKKLSLLFCLFCLPHIAISQNGASETDIFGTIRPVYTFVETRDRAGETSTSSVMNARIQLGINHQFNDRFTFRGRVASRYATTQGQFRFIFDDHTPGGGSYPPGTTTIDEFSLLWQARPDLLITGGRFQGRFPLAGFIPKGVDRYYAANLSIAHTDGLSLRWNMSPSWRMHLIGSHNGKKGSSHAARAPLAFEEPLSRFSFFANLEHRDTGGIWVQREASISYNPQTFIRRGVQRDYIVLSTRGMIRLPFDPGTGEYWLGGEVGVVPLAPLPRDSGFLVEESRTIMNRSSFAWQVSAYANDLFSRHRIGILYGQTEPNWLVSSSFRPNVTMSEIRYRFTINSRLNYEMRFRIQTDLFKPDDAEFTRRDRDFYARFTYRF